MPWAMALSSIHSPGTGRVGPGWLKWPSACGTAHARQAQSLANQISSYLMSKNSNKLTSGGWSEIKGKLSIYPLGLSEIELNIIKILKEHGEVRLTNLSAKTNLTKDMLQKNVEMYLMRNNLIEIRPTGRALTKKGHDYHKEHLSK
jgi:Holliday junction resolvasome RuvABC ATP-dependent DNA helicase subunit